MTNSAATPTVEYRVFTTSGRMFIWSATDSQDLIDRVYTAGHVIASAMLESAYEAQETELDGFEQLEHNHNLEVA